MLTPIEIQEMLIEKYNELCQKTEEYTKALYEYSKMKAEYEKEYSKCYLLIKTEAEKQTVKEIEMKVEEKLKDLKFNLILKEGELKALGKLIDTNEKQIEILRTLLSYQKIEYSGGIE